jgi:hypothetical protein
MGVFYRWIANTALTTPVMSLLQWTSVTRHEAMVGKRDEHCVEHRRLPRSRLAKRNQSVGEESKANDSGQNARLPAHSWSAQPTSMPPYWTVAATDLRAATLPCPADHGQCPVNRQLTGIKRRTPFLDSPPLTTSDICGYHPAPQLPGNRLEIVRPYYAEIWERSHHSPARPLKADT